MVVIRLPSCNKTFQGTDSTMCIRVSVLYTSVHCYSFVLSDDDSRVVLSTNDGGSEYINASFINVSTGGYELISF